MSMPPGTLLKLQRLLQELGVCAHHFFGDSGKTQGPVALLYTKEMLPGVYTNN